MKTSFVPRLVSIDSELPGSGLLVFTCVESSLIARGNSQLRRPFLLWWLYPSKLLRGAGSF